MSHKLTNAQAQSIIDNNDIYKRETLSGDTVIFDCYHLTARLDGFTYQVIEKDTNNLASDADKATVDAYFKTQLMTKEYQGTNVVKTDTKIE